MSTVKRRVPGTQIPGRYELLVVPGMGIGRRGIIREYLGNWRKDDTSTVRIVRVINFFFFFPSSGGWGKIKL